MALLFRVSVLAYPVFGMWLGLHGAATAPQRLVRHIERRLRVGCCRLAPAPIDRCNLHT